MKLCISCQQEKEITEFHKYKTTKDGYHYYCKECRKQIESNPSRLRYAREYYSRRINEDRQYAQHNQRFRRYGITPEKYLEMFDTQEGKCAICGEPEQSKYKNETRSLAVDHCHKTGEVRSLLCNSCNNGLGRFKDNPERLRAAASYLDLYSGVPAGCADSI